MTPARQFAMPGRVIWRCLAALLAAALSPAGGLAETLPEALARAEAAAQRAPGEPAALRELTWLLHEAGAGGDREAVVRCVATAQAWRAADPASAAARAWLGSAQSLRARDLPLTQKMPALREGQTHLDGAVEAAPEDVEARLVRAANAMRLPTIFGRRKVARADFALLEQWLAERPEAFPGALHRAALALAGEWALLEGSPRSVALLRAAAEAPAPEFARERVRALLAKAERQFAVAHQP